MQQIICYTTNSCLITLRPQLLRHLYSYLKTNKRIVGRHVCSSKYYMHFRPEEEEEEKEDTNEQDSISIIGENNMASVMRKGTFGHMQKSVDKDQPPRLRRRVWSGSALFDTSHINSTYISYCVNSLIAYRYFQHRCEG